MARSELASMEPGELADRLAEARRELFNLRFQRATGQLDNTARLGQVRREVARALTYLRQHELGIEEGGGDRIDSSGGEPSAVSAPAAEEDTERARRSRRVRRSRAAAVEAVAHDEAAVRAERGDHNDDVDGAAGVDEDSEEA